MKKILLALAFCSSVFAAETSVDSSKVQSVEQPVPAVADSASSAVTPVDMVAATQANYDAEIALRDSLLSAKDSAHIAETQAMQTKLDIESARCGNWEQSYAVLDTNFQTCSKMLRVYAETAEKKTEQLNEARKMNAMAQSTSFIGGVLIGILVGWLIWD